MTHACKLLCEIMRLLRQLDDVIYWGIYILVSDQVLICISVPICHISFNASHFHEIKGRECPPGDKVGVPVEPVLEKLAVQVEKKSIGNFFAGC